MKKKMLALLLTFCMIFSLLPVSAFAIEPGEVSASRNATYNAADDDITVTLSIQGKDVTGSVTEAKPVDVVLVVDNSGSMSDGAISCDSTEYHHYGWFGLRWQCDKCGKIYSNHPNGECSGSITKMSAAKKSAYLLMDELGTASQENQLAVVGFTGSFGGEQSELISPSFWTELNGDACYSLQKLIPDSEGVKGLDGAISSMNASGGTNYTAGLAKAQKYLGGSNQEKYVIFISDGVPGLNEHGLINYPEMSAWNGTEQADALKADGVKIYTIGLGMKDDSALQKLATGTDYVYNLTDENAINTQLPALIQDIATKIYPVNKFAGTEAAITDEIPEGFTVVEGSLSDGLTYHESTKTVTWTIGDITETEKSVSYKIKPISDSLCGNVETTAGTVLKYKDSDKVSQEKNITCSPINLPSSKLNYNANGGLGGPAAVAVRQGKQVTLSETKPTHVAEDEIPVIFVGWTSKKVEKILGKDDSAPSTVPSPLTLTEETTTICAAWAYDTDDDGEPDYNETKYTVTYQWAGDVPADVTQPTDNNQYVKDQKYTVDSQYTSDTVIEVKDSNGNVTDRYTFSGWKQNGTVVTGKQQMPAANVELTGEWTHDEVKPTQHNVTYQWDGNAPASAELPTSVKVDHNAPYTPTATYEPVKTAEGTWTFNGWTPESIEHVLKDEPITGSWTFTPATPTEVTVTYKVVNGTWADGRTEITETLTPGAALSNIPDVSTAKANKGCTGGAWDTVPTSETTVSVNTIYTYTFEKIPVWHTAYNVIRVYMDDATQADFDALEAPLLQQVRIYSDKYSTLGYRLCLYMPIADYWYTTNLAINITAADIEKIALAKDNVIGSSDMISIPIEGNDTYKVTVSEGTEWGSLIKYLKIEITKNPDKVTYSVIYDRNGADSGTVPVDSNRYSSGAVVTVQGNTGNLAKDKAVFLGFSKTENDLITTAEQKENAGIIESFNITGTTKLYAVWAKDENGDGTPDYDQYRVTYKVVNGTWENGSTEIVDYVTFNAAGEAQLGDIPDVSAVKPNTNYLAKGTWDVEPVEGTAITKSTTYTYTLEKNESAWENTYKYIRIYMDEGTQADFDALEGSLSQQVRIYSEKYWLDCRYTAPMDGYWWTENSRSITANDISSIVLAKDEWIGSSSKIEIPMAGNDLYSVSVSAGSEFYPVDNCEYTYLRIDITKNPPAPKTITFTYKAGENGNLTGELTETVTVSVNASASPAKVPTPKANEGYKFAGWQIGEGSSAGLVTSEQLKSKLFSEDTTFTAIFKEKGGSGVDVDDDEGGGTIVTKKYKIDASAGKGGDISPDGTVKVSKGASKAFTITADKGYKISDVLVDGESVGKVSSYTFKNVQENHTIKAIFAKLPTDPDDSGTSNWLNTKDHFAYMNGYPDSTFGPNRNMTRAEVAQMFYALLLDKDVTTTVAFSDVPADAWYAKAVNTLASLGMVTGYPDGTFHPDASITRAEFATIAMAFAYELKDADCNYYDVPENAWFYTYVAQATTYGWIGGSNGYFRPNDMITRAEVSVIVNNMLGRAADEDYVDKHEDDLVTFPDVKPSYWAYYSIMETVNDHEYTKDNGLEDWK